MEAKDGVLARGRILESAGMDRIDDRTSEFELDAGAVAGAAAGPAGVNQPNVRLVLFDFVRQQLRVLGGMPDKERRAEAGREGGCGLSDSDFGPSDLWRCSRR